MKKALAGFMIVSLLAIGAVAYAHGSGRWAGGSMRGSGYVCNLQEADDSCYGPQHRFGRHMSGWTGDYDRKFLDETVDTRKELHNKKFEYFEAVRNPEADPETVNKLEKEISELQEKLYEKAPRTVNGRYGGYGCRW